MVVTIARKPIEAQSVAHNVLLHLAGCLNIDQTRIDSDQPAKACSGSGWKSQNEKNAEQGYRSIDYYAGQQSWAYKPSDKGRFPANVVMCIAGGSRYFKCL